MVNRSINVLCGILASRLMRYVCPCCVLNFVWLSFRMRNRARDALAAETADMISSPFRMRLLLLLLDVEEEVVVVAE